jgi:hypothetical protein
LRLNNKLPVEKMLKHRWQETNPADKVRTLWDLALIEVFINPEYATIKRVSTPVENLRRMIGVYTQIDVSKMKSDFYESLQSSRN